ncbi:MAG TPA: DUF4386 family protein [Anaerolineales bacterium]|nr:DUF4386 family protein [Anaerolineales bacterium]
MKNNALTNLGGICSILLGVSYVLVGALYLLLPADQKSAADPAAFYASVAANPTLIRIYYLVFALGSVLALGAVPAISEAVRSLHEGWVRWTSNLAFLGFAVLAIDFFRVSAFQAYRAAVFVAGDASTRAAIDATDQGLDPQGWLGFGGVGAWVLVVSLLALRGGRWPSSLAYLGIAIAVLYWLIVVSFVFDIAILLSIVAGLGGVVLAPIWYIWVGLRLRQAG